MNNEALLGLISSLLKTGGLSNSTPTGSKPAPGGSSRRDFTFKDIVSFESNSIFDVVLDNHPDNELDCAVIQGKEDQINNIELIESNGHLSMKSKTGSYDKVTITLTSRHLSKLKIAGTGTLSGNYKGKALEVINVGTADVILKGQVGKLNVTNKGTGDISLSDLQAEDIIFSNIGTGDVKMWGTKSVSGTCAGTGDVSTSGIKPSAIKNTGLGDVIYCGEKKATATEDMQTKSEKPQKNESKVETKKYSNYKL